MSSAQFRRNPIQTQMFHTTAPARHPIIGPMSHRRREALGRNRQGPQTRNTVPIFIAGMVLISAAGLATVRYFTAPQRVFGAKYLKCPAYQVQWHQVQSGARSEHHFLIYGCGKEIEAGCQPEGTCFHFADTDFGPLRFD